MSTIGTVFTVRSNRKVRHLKSQGLDLEFWYYDEETGRQFDVRMLPVEHIKDDGAAVRAGDPDAHRRVIQRALVAGFDFKAVN
jgi:hypothetical protein